jgi:redox-sensitive bicupin YhaK (pirin superfamily)
MLTVRKSHERGHSNHGWLDSYHTFSFSDYHDPRWMGFGPLRVINDDRIAAGGGFPTHSHRDMEIVTYVLEGTLQHQDSLGNGGTIVPGEVQRMRAGRGIAHSEYNASQTTPVHLLQIWIEPDMRNLDPGYEQKAFNTAEMRGQFRIVASADGRDGSVTIHQNAAIYAAKLAADEQASMLLPAGRRAWLHVATGRVQIKGYTLEAGDSVALVQEPELTLVGFEAAEVLLFDLA